ncbi:MAG TPA: NADPH-dependent FMN reductase [Mycobacterium sp.]|jgi:NAD(P)H-dependent FMN reductase
MTTADDVNLLVLVGSLRAGSVNRQIAELAARSAPEGVSVTLYEGLGEVPFYNEDVDDGNAPAAATALRGAVADADAVLVVTPEYNGSIPAVVKNAIDWLSRPYGQSAVTAKPLAVIGAALGRFGGEWAHDETRKSFGIAGARVIDGLTLSAPIASLNGAHPRDSAELVENIRAVVDMVAAEGAGSARAGRFAVTSQ